VELLKKKAQDLRRKKEQELRAKRLSGENIRLAEKQLQSELASKLSALDRKRSDAERYKNCETACPTLRGTGYTLSSEATSDYNCIGWAAGDDQNWWWPIEDDDVVWPVGVPFEATVEAFKLAFATLGYEPCDDGSLEYGYEKVAIYFRDDIKRVQHMARQKDDGRWLSKLGHIDDITHRRVTDVAAPVYGKVVAFLKRKMPSR
jgi:hypothetical protein